MRSPATPTGTPGRIPPVCLFPPQKLRACIHEHLHLLWYAGSSTYSECKRHAKQHGHVRFPRILVDDVFGSEVKEARADDSNHHGHYRSRCDAVFLGDIFRAFRVRYDSESRACKSYLPSLEWDQWQLTRYFPGTNSAPSRPVSYSPITPRTTILIPFHHPN